MLRVTFKTEKHWKIYSGGQDKMKKYLCIEDNEEFIIEAENLAQAKNDASIYNASVIKEIK